MNRDDDGADWRFTPELPAFDWVEPRPPIPHRPEETHPAYAAWQAHVDAGRIGRREPTLPHIAAARDRMTALFSRRGGAR